MTFSESSIGTRRVVSQRITHSHFKNAGEVAAWVGAMQGQDYAGTKWAFGLRCPGSTESDINQAIKERQIVRVWALRGTLHYVAPADVHWIVGLIAPRQIAGNALRYRQLELDEPTLARSIHLIGAALSDAQHLTRAELFAMLEANGIVTTGQRGFYMLQRAGLERVLVQGEMRGAETTFIALEAGKTLPVEQAAAELARRYFTSHAPATLADFTHWSGLLAGEARTGLEAVKSTLHHETINGQTVWSSPDAPKMPERSVYLLPGFDEFVLGYRDRSGVLEPQYTDAICPGGSGMFTPTIVCNGRIIGTWKRAIKKKAVEIALTPFYPLDDDIRQAIAGAADGYGAFLELPVKLGYTL